MLTRDSDALSAWYNSRPEIRRLWAIRDTQGLRVVIHLEPTNDGNDTNPAWMANSRAWVDELQLHTGGDVRLEQIDEVEEIESDAEGVVIAAFSWRDPSVI
jgi:hypothetical protein